MKEKVNSNYYLNNAKALVVNLLNIFPAISRSPPILILSTSRKVIALIMNVIKYTLKLSLNNKFASL